MLYGLYDCEEQTQINPSLHSAIFISHPEQQVISNCKRQNPRKLTPSLVTNSNVAASNDMFYGRKIERTLTLVTTRSVPETRFVRRMREIASTSCLYDETIYGNFIKKILDFSLQLSGFDVIIYFSDHGFDKDKAYFIQLLN